MYLRPETGGRGTEIGAAFTVTAAIEALRAGWKTVTEAVIYTAAIRAILMNALPPR